MSNPQIAIVGAGAAGLFTAYELGKRLGNTADVVVLEAKDRIGGNAHSIPVSYQGQTFIVDAGAQFFSRQAQPNYCSLLDELGILDDPEIIIDKASGVSVWNQAKQKLNFRVPATLDGLLPELRKDPFGWLQFGIFILAALELNRQGGDGATTVDEWLDGLPVITGPFKSNVILPFLYQFDTVPPDQLGACSALYSITYLARSVPQLPPHGDADVENMPLFTVLNSSIGLEGILELVARQSNARIELSSPVLEVASASGGWTVTTAKETLTVDHVVFAANAPVAGKILAAGGAPGDLTSLLESFEFVPLHISMQMPESCYMPEDEAAWEAVNILTGSDNDMFSVYFGLLRDRLHDGSLLNVFKSWGSPGLQPPSCDAHFMSELHHIMVPTPAFMSARSQLTSWQGWNGLYFAGGWTNWFDSQESALVSAIAVADSLAPNAVAAQRRVETPDTAAQGAFVRQRIITPALAGLGESLAAERAAAEAFLAR